MSQIQVKQDEIKRKLRKLKKLEIKIRFSSNGLHNNIKETSSENKNSKLVWNRFFDLKDDGLQNNVKYPISKIILMSKDEFKEIIQEYFYHVYYWFCRENGITDDNKINVEILTELGLPIYADDTEIKRKFRELAKTYHPDNGGDSTKFMEVMEKYKNL